MSTTEKRGLDVEEFFSQLRGEIDLLTEAVSLLVAKHPENKIVFGELAARMQQVVATDSGQEKHRKLGYALALGVLARRTDLKESQLQSEDIPPQDKH